MAWNETGLPWGARLWSPGQSPPNTPGSLYAAQEPAIQRTFREARQRFGSAMAALSPGNVRARQEGEANLATQESDILTALRQRSQQEEFENLMRILGLYGQTTGAAGSETAAGYARPRSSLMGGIGLRGAGGAGAGGAAKKEKDNKGISGISG